MSARLEFAVTNPPVASGRLACSGRRNDVQGLRGVAVLLVVLYHAGVPWLPGGFVGVDVFFVISGFLITGLLTRELLTTGRIAFARFYARRARRLLPASLLVTIVTAATALWIYPPMEQREVVSGARAASLYLINHWLAGRSIDYLGGDAESNPLLHMWSLAVEEQFYLVWPLVVALGIRMRGGRRLWLAIGALSVASLAACVFMTWHAQPWAFFLMPMRAWEFGAGALAQVAALRGAGSGNARWARWLGWSGLAVVVASAGCLDTSRLYPGLWALAPTLGTVAVLLCIYASESGLGALLAVSPLRVIGDLSYSWYLWHWPFLVGCRVLVPQAGPATTVFAVCLSIVAAAISYRWVERPIRVTPPAWLKGSQQALTASLAASALVAGACTVTASWIGARGMDATQRAFAEAVSDIPRIYAAGCHATVTAIDQPACVFGNASSATRIVLFGDSHAAQWFPAVEQLATKRGWRLVSLTKSSCPAVQMAVYSDVLRRRYFECDEWRERMFKRIESERPALVVISDSSHYSDAAQWRAAAARTARRLADLGARQLWVRDTPSPGFDGPRCLARAQWQGRTGIQDLCAFDRDKVMATTTSIFEAERQATAGIASVRWLDLSTAICPVERCTVLRAGRPLYSDSNHLAASWAQRQSPRFAEALEGWPLDWAVAPEDAR